MANNKILLGILAITLVFGLTFMGCDEIKDVLNPEGDGNPFIGEWSGTFIPKVSGVEGDEIDATITFTDTKWTLTAGETGPSQIKLSGTYSDSIIPSIGGSKTVDLNSQDGIIIASATYTSILTVKTIKVNFILSTYNGSSGSFKSGGSNTDSFVGKWSGTYDNDPSATITFTDTTWSLKHGTTTQSGQYTKSSIGYTATLTISEITFGTAALNPITGTLTITVGLNKGSFTRAP
jgi:hypothetical protein